MASCMATRVIAIPSALMRQCWKELRRISSFAPNHLPSAKCEGLGFLGLELNEARNAGTAAVISTDGNGVTVRVIRTDEELMIARSVCRVRGISPAI